MADEVKKSQQRLQTLAKQLGTVSSNGKPILEQTLSLDDGAKLIGHTHRNWVSRHVEKEEDGRLDMCKTVAAWVASIRSEQRAAVVDESDRQRQRTADEISQRKKLAEAQRAERELRLADLRIARLEAKLMPVDWVHRMLDEMAAELRKPIEIIGRNHPEYQQMIINGLDNAMDKVSIMLADDQPIG